MQIVYMYILSRRRVLRRLFCVYTVCQCPLYGTLGVNRLISSLPIMLMEYVSIQKISHLRLNAGPLAPDASALITVINEQRILRSTLSGEATLKFDSFLVKKGLL